MGKRKQWGIMGEKGPERYFMRRDGFPVVKGDRDWMNVWELSIEERWEAQKQDDLLKRANFAWCQDQLTDDEYDRIKEMIRSQDKDNYKVAESLLNAIDNKL